jgi:4-amino-4-deoxy-L-arabinose transferase-like glycosyltransferase
MTRLQVVWFTAGALFVAALCTAPLVPILDPDEGYYPATAAESVDAGSAWDPRLNGSPRWDKPILTYTLIEASFAAFGRTVPAARLPSALHGALLALITGVVVARFRTPRAAWMATVVLATTLGVQAFARIAHPEIVVVTAVTAAEFLIACWIAASRERTRLCLASAIGVAVGYGVLAKGPVALALPALAAICSLAWLRSSRDTWRQAVRDGALAAVVALIVAVPWYAAMTARHGWMFLEQSVWQHNVSRYTGGAFRHPWSLLYFVLPTLLLMFPWSGFLLSVLRRRPVSHGSTRDILRVVMTMSAATTFAFYSLSASKLPHYALAVVPPLATLIGLSMDEMLNEERQRAGAVQVTAVTCFTLGVLFVAAPWAIHHWFTGHELFGGALPRDVDIAGMVDVAMWPVAVLLICAGIALLTAARRAFWLMAATGALLPVVVIVGARPLLWYAYPWQQLGREVRQMEGPVWMVGPRAPSLTFFAGRPITRVDKADIEQLMSQDVDGWLVGDTHWLSELSSGQMDGHTLTPIGSYGSMTLSRLHPAPRNHAAHDDERSR